ncbi:MAG: transketolase [Deltaproteobacteria bacterium]|nr:transketolase [Deltaproteobacteria bacterium]
MGSPDQLDQLAIDTIRCLSMDAIQAANSGHPGAPLGLAPVGWLIFNALRSHDPAHPEWADRDRFVMSCGHASMLQYSLLHLSGYDLPLDELRAFRQWDSKTPGHPEFGHTAGVDTTTGPLGQGFANAVGMALAERHLAGRFNRPGHEIVDHHTWTIASDGDFMEGISSEAGSLAGHLGLGKLVVFWDDNSITIDGRTDITFTEDVVARFDAFGWHTQSVDDGNDLIALGRAAEAAKNDPRPSLIRVKTIIGWPAPNKQNTSKAHGSPLGPEEITATKKLMGWPDESFRVPSDLGVVTDGIKARGQAGYAAWQEKFAAYRSDHPELAAAFEEAMAGKLPSGWDRGVTPFEADAKGMATRKSSGAVIAAISQTLGNLVGGSADLAASNLSYQKGFADFGGPAVEQGPGAEAGPRNVHWGIREHAMASACNGMALHGGVIPYGATFLVFSDYMRPAIRLAALMQIPVRYLFTHDSIGVGEDGPTHQPVEHLAALRTIPGMTTIRPGDANEVIEAWKAMLGRPGPVALVLTRQSMPTVDRTVMSSAEGVHRGAYVLSEAAGDGDPEVILIGTGSEVSIALAAQKDLAADGVRARVVSMPSWELFAEEDRAYRDSVLPPAVSARVVVEAGIRMGWERWVGSEGGFVTLEHYGASAPATVLYEKFGLTAEAMVAEAKRLLG